MAPNEKASVPVHKVGGQKDRGPWPRKVDEIERGRQYARKVSTPKGPVEATVQVEEIREFVDQQGNPTGGYAVTFTHQGGEE